MRADQPGERLLDGWVRQIGLLAPRAAPDDVAAAGRELLARYAEPHRAYHDVTHLSEVLAAVDALAAHATDLPVVVAAAWWHDAVYDVRAAGDANEAASAALASSVLRSWSVEPARAARVGVLVRMTARHDPAPGDRDAEVLSDADLAVLAAGPERYASYVGGVRREYAHVPDAAFAAGRAAVLADLLGHDGLYRTPTGRSRWEDLARANLRRELSALR